MKRLQGRQVVEIAFWFIFAVLAYYFSFSFDREIEIYRFGASGWPRVIIVGIFVVTLCLLLQQLRSKSGGTEAEKEPGTAPEQSEEGEKSSAAQVAAALVTPVIFAVILPYTGFYVTTPFFVLAFLVITGERRPAFLVAVPLAISVVLILFFTRVFYVGLPVGYWHPFYDISNWLITVIQ